jgi:hypothetical protein
MRKVILLVGLALAFASLAFGGDVTGKWNLTADDGGDGIKLEMIINADGGKITGTISDSEGARPIQEAKFMDGILTCRWTYGGTPVSLKFTVDGDKLKGSYETDTGSAGEILGVRAVAAMQDKSSASVAGSWDLIMTRPDSSQVKMVLKLERKEDKWAGRMVVPDYNLDCELTDIRVEGENVSFKVPTIYGIYEFAGKATGAKFDGTCNDPDAGTKNKVLGTRGAA